jgi:hypothetical protein
MPEAFVVPDRRRVRQVMRLGLLRRFGKNVMLPQPDAQPSGHRVAEG